MAQLLIREAPDFVPAPESRYDDRWGVGALVEDTYVITRHLHQRGAIDAARLAAPVPVTYRTVTGEERTDHLLGLVWRPAERWVWAVNGWAVERPGDVASEPAIAPPDRSTPWEVRVWSQPPGTFGVDYGGSAPHWSTLAWTDGLARAREIAEALLASDVDHDELAEVWGPDGQGGQLLHAIRRAPERRRRLPKPPRLPRGSDWPVEAAPAPPAGELGYELRVWRETAGWHTMARCTCRQFACIVASRLGVGDLGSPYRFGEVWGPAEAGDARRVHCDYVPDVDLGDSARLAELRGAL